MLSFSPALQTLLSSCRRGGVGMVRSQFLWGFVDSLVWKGPLRSPCSNPPALSRNTFHQTRLLQATSTWPWTVPEPGHPQLLWETCSSVSPNPDFSPKPSRASRVGSQCFIPCPWEPCPATWLFPVTRVGSPHGALQERICSKRAAVAICSPMGCPWASADLHFVPGAPPSPPPSLILLFPVLFLSFSPHTPPFACVAGFALCKTHFPRDGLSRVCSGAIRKQLSPALGSSPRGSCNSCAASTLSWTPNRASNDI